MKKVKQPYFTSVTHDYNSADKLEVGGTLICHRLLEKKKQKRERDFIQFHLNVRSSKPWKKVKKPVAALIMMYKNKRSLGTKFSQLNEKENGWKKWGESPPPPLPPPRKNNSPKKINCLPENNCNHLYRLWYNIVL